MDRKAQAYALIREFKGDAYVHALHCFGQLGAQAASMGRRASVVISGFGKPWGPALHQETREALDAAQVEIAGPFIEGAQPNSPREDVFRIAAALAEQSAEVVIAVGGGSGIDAVKAAVAYWTLRDDFPEIDPYFGMQKVGGMLAETGGVLPPVLAVQLASGSAAHLTKYSNITDTETGQKLLMIDECLVPAKCVFDYAKTTSMSKAFTMDGGLDGHSHALEVYYGIPEAQLARVEPVSLLAIETVLNSLKQACLDPNDLDARESLGLATDLGGYAIMIGGTNGAHLNSFSFVDVLVHGRAVALMNPYYTVFFAPAIEERLRRVAQLYRNAGYLSVDPGHLSGRGLGIALAEAMIAFSQELGFPTTLAQVPGFGEEHIRRALSAAKNPALESKLRNMPVPLSANQVDRYMGGILEAACTGDFKHIENMPS